MRFRVLSMLVLGALCVVPAVVRSAETRPSANATRFEALKKLAGDWVQVGEDGKPTAAVASSIRVTGAGSVVQETLFPGTDHEMVTMYHLDGADLVLTHYCAVGNQPRMRADGGKDPSRIEFKFTGGSNLKPGEMYMDHATMTLLGPDRFKAVWVACKEGKECHTGSFDLVRKK